ASVPRKVGRRRPGEPPLVRAPGAGRLAHPPRAMQQRQRGGGNAAEATRRRQCSRGNAAEAMRLAGTASPYLLRTRQRQRSRRGAVPNETPPTS
ncbi:MAG: hypothetical protein ACOX9C_12980, partial [Kiritimatiellia bacterium]